MFAGTRNDLPTIIHDTAGDGNYYKVAYNRSGRTLSNLRAALPSFWRASTMAETAPSADFTWTGAIEYPLGSGTLYNFTLGGQRSITVPIAQWGMLSDAITGLSIPDGAAFGIYSQPRVAASGNFFPVNNQRLLVLSAGDRSERGAMGTLTDRIAAGTKPTTVAVSYGYFPVLTGDADGAVTEVVLLMGDSIGGGQAENVGNVGTMDAYGNIGPIERRFTVNSSYLNICRSGSRAFDWANGTQPLTNAMIAAMGVTWNTLIDELGANDYNQNLLATDTVTRRGTAIAKWKGSAARVICTTCNPILAIDARPVLSATNTGTSASNVFRYYFTNTDNLPQTGDAITITGMTPTIYNVANKAVSASGSNWVECIVTTGQVDATVMGNMSSFTSPTSQSVSDSSKNAQRIAGNNSVRAKAIAGQTHYIDVADAMENGRDAGVYKSRAVLGTPASPDGIHPLSGPNILAAQAPVL
ncbi:hypothetical protein ASE49_09190 [Novosphingobium sp. Leaf2]|nr:hypothetical protein ASE49_09190 [Novosphingobium sp. Leaf2]